jgi:hypothetical protein
LRTDRRDRAYKLAPTVDNANSRSINFSSNLTENQETLRFGTPDVCGGLVLRFSNIGTYAPRFQCGLYMKDGKTRTKANDLTI